ncbi:MAG: hypothetical protein GXC73_04210, partial [Chitinophagaceae bacterium]|nr:hypothetical protein [Chitinophagaceae bacterium]
MKRFKQIEFFLSSVLIAGFLLLGFVSGNIDWLLTAYFTIGAIHVFGMFVHAY